MSGENQDALVAGALADRLPAVAVLDRVAALQGLVADAPAGGALAAAGRHDAAVAEAIDAVSEVVGLIPVPGATVFADVVKRQARSSPAREAALRDALEQLIGTLNPPDLSGSAAQRAEFVNSLVSRYDDAYGNYKGLAE